MLKKITLGAAAAVSALVAMPAAAEAQYRGSYYDRGYTQQYDRYDRYDRRQARQAARAERRYYRDQRRYANQYGNSYYGNRYDNRYYGNRRCGSGSTGTIVGAIAGGLLGREVVGRYGDRTAGTIVGGAVGALTGRAIDRNC